MIASTLHATDQAADCDDLFRLYSRELTQYAYRRLNDREAASDVVQDGFLRFLVWYREQREPLFPNGARFFLWRIVGNLTIDVVRRRRVLGTVTPLDDLKDLLVDPNPGPERCLEVRQQYQLLKAALDELPERHRSALLLNRIDGLSHVEIGARLGVSASMVSKYIMSVLEHCLTRVPDILR